jgi:hypothetical protein
MFGLFRILIVVKYMVLELYNKLWNNCFIFGISGHKSYYKLKAFRRPMHGFALIPTPHACQVMDHRLIESMCKDLLIKIVRLCLDWW